MPSFRIAADGNLQPFEAAKLCIARAMNLNLLIVRPRATGWSSPSSVGPVGSGSGVGWTEAEAGEEGQERDGGGELQQVAAADRVLIHGRPPEMIGTILISHAVG